MKLNRKSVISYKDIFDGAELRCRIHGEGVKEDLILHKPEAVSDTYSCLYQMKIFVLYCATMWFLF